MVTIDSTLCTGCGKCVADCIAKNLRVQEKKAVVQKECFLCGHCVSICPYHAVSIPEYDMADVESCSSDTFTLNPASLLHTIKCRRSIRSYETEKIEQEKLELLVQAGRYTATAKNNQDCHFIFVQEELPVLKTFVWEYIEKLEEGNHREIPRELLPYISFNRQRKANPKDDYLFRNAPAVLYITSDWPLDAGLAAQNIELIAVSQGLGALYNGFLARISDENKELKKWLGIEGKAIKACMLLGYPKVSYQRSAPRKPANVIWK